MRFLVLLLAIVSVAHSATLTVGNWTTDGATHKVQLFSDSRDEGTPVWEATLGPEQYEVLEYLTIIQPGEKLFLALDGHFLNETTGFGSGFGPYRGGAERWYIDESASGDWELSWTSDVEFEAQRSDTIVPGYSDGGDGGSVDSTAIVTELQDLKRLLAVLIGVVLANLARAVWPIK